MISIWIKRFYTLSALSFVTTLFFIPVYADSTSVKPMNGDQPSPPKYQTSAVFVPASASGGVSSQLYLYNQHCNSGWTKYQLNNGSPYIIIPTTGTYVVSYYIQAYNNNSGSVEWNDMQFNLNYQPPGQTNLLVSGGTISPSMTGGGCSSCTQYNIPYYWWNTSPPTQFVAGTLLWISGEVSASGTSCSGNSVLITGGGIGVTQQ